MDFQDIVLLIGNKASGITKYILDFLASKGIFTSVFTSKLLTFAVILFIAYLVIFVIETLKKPIKFVLSLILILLALSVGYSLIA